MVTYDSIKQQKSKKESKNPEQVRRLTGLGIAGTVLLSLGGIALFLTPYFLYTKTNKTKSRGTISTPPKDFSSFAAAKVSGEQDKSAILPLNTKTDDVVASQMAQSAPAEDRESLIEKSKDWLEYFGYDVEELSNEDLNNLGLYFQSLDPKIIRKKDVASPMAQPAPAEYRESLIKKIEDAFEGFELYLNLHELPTEELEEILLEYSY